MRDPGKLRIVAAAKTLAVTTYLVTSKFPDTERYGLSAQLRRAAVSVGSNIVEGCHRKGDAAFVPFLPNALGSAAEMQFQLEVAAALGCGELEEIRRLHGEADHLRRMVIRLILALRTRRG